MYSLGHQEWPSNASFVTRWKTRAARRLSLLVQAIWKIATSYLAEIKLQFAGRLIRVCLTKMDVIKILIIALLLLAFRIKNYDSRLCFNIFKIVPAEGNFRTIRECGQDDPAAETCYKYVHLSQLFLNCLKFLNK